MKITYVGSGELNYITNMRSYMFSAGNNFTIDVTNYEDIYTMIKDSRHGTSLKLDKDPAIIKAKKYVRPGIVTMAANPEVLSGAKMVVSTTTASGKDKVQEVKDLDKIIDDIVVSKPDDDVKEIIKETKKKLNKTKPKTKAKK